MVASPRWDDAKRLFHEAQALPPAEREAFLCDACRDAPDLLAEVRSLLSWSADAGGFLETPIARVADLPLTFPTPDPFLGQTLGPWRLVAVIGGGGMGVVYRAERADAAFRRPAAVKVIRRGARAADIVVRFHRERETLAALDHPNLARLLDGGTTPDAQPYYVMEYVDGVRVDAYCDERRLTVDERLDLFRTICGGVQYAHQMLVVHRDLKPDNILVSRDGVPKLLDFGIARVLSDAPAGVDETTTEATWLMTPDFASPEQINGRPVTTAADVYSLGVLLHVLLVGSPPYRLTGATQAELRAQLTSAVVERPSDRATTSAEAAAVAASRKTTPRRLARRLRGDLDAILLRALDRDPRVRYGTVEQFALDLQRHRTGHPVAARPRSVGYVSGRFARRHAAALSAAAAIVILAAGGIAGVLWQAAIAREAQGRAERRFADVRRLAHVFMFDVHDAIVNVPGTTRARALMVRTASEYLQGLADEATGDLGLQRELASAFVRVGDAQGHPTSANVGDTAGARASYERAIVIAGAILTVAPADIEAERTRAMAHRRLADVLAWAGDLTAALTHCTLSDRLFDAVARHPSAGREDALQAAIAELKMGDLLGNPNLPNLGRAPDAVAAYDRALEMLRRLDGDPPDERVRRYVGIMFERIGTMHEVAGDWRAAGAAYTESFRIRDALAGGAPFHTDIQRDLAIAYEKLGNIQLSSGDVPAAARSYRGALAQFTRLAEADPSNAIAARSVAISREKLAGPLLTLDRPREALDLLRAARNAHDKLSSGDPDNAQARCDVARLDEALGNAWMETATGSHAPAAGRACAYWRDSLTARRQLLTQGIDCVTGDEVTRMGVKVRQCE